MGRQNERKPQAPKRSHLGKKKNVTRRKKIALATLKRRREEQAD